MQLWIMFICLTTCLLTSFPLLTGLVILSKLKETHLEFYSLFLLFHDLFSAFVQIITNTNNMYGYRISLICIIQIFGANVFLVFSVVYDMQLVCMIYYFKLIICDHCVLFGVRYFHIVSSCGYDHYWVDILIVCKGIENFQFGYGIWASMFFFPYFSTNKLR
jgi:hypothetical protein